MIMIQVALNAAMRKCNKISDELFYEPSTTEGRKAVLKEELLKANAEVKALELELEGVKKATK